MPSKVDAVFVLYTESVLSYRKFNLQYYKSISLIPEADNIGQTNEYTHGQAGTTL
jgi:hypothetical protein